MKYQQTDIVEINFMLPGFKFKPHLAVIVSNNELHEKETFFYAVLITSKPYFPEYTYTLSDKMIDFKLSKKSYIKCHVITSDMETGVLRKVGKMKEPYFTEMTKKVIQSIF